MANRVIGSPLGLPAFAHIDLGALPRAGTRKLNAVQNLSATGAGMGGATAREITARASANLASIPYHFGSKDALVAEALIAETRDLIAPVLDLLTDDRPAAERATEAVSMLNDLFERSRPQVPVYLAALATSPHSPPVAEGLAALWSEVRTALVADIAGQLNTGTLPGWVDPQAMAGLILSLVNGVVIGAQTDPDGPDHRAIAAQFLSLLLAAGTVGADPTLPPETIP